MNNGKLIDRQVIVTWYTPKEKLPPDGMMVVASISGKNTSQNIEYDHAIAIMEYWNDSGWENSDGLKFRSLTVHAWADLEAYKG